MANLYLDGVFDDKSASPSTVRITVPNPGVGGPIDVKGLLIGDPQFSLQNKWGPIISDITNLTDFSSLWGTAGIFSWISASTNCWKGTSPISVAISFYLINYKRNGLNFESKLKSLAKLAAVGKTGGMLESMQVTVHGGYQADVLETNTKYFTDSKGLEKMKGNVGAGIQKTADLVLAVNENNMAKGAVALIFGNKNAISNLLLVKLDVTESTIEVADQAGGSRKPLFYKVDAQFVGVAPVTTDDVDYMFTGGGR